MAVSSKYKRWIVRALFVLALLILASVTWWHWEIAEGRKAWRRYAESAWQRGVKLTIDEFFTPAEIPVPPDQNFANSPLWDLIFSDPDTTSIPYLPHYQQPKKKTRYADLGTWRAAFIRDQWLEKTDTAGNDAEAILRGLEKYRTCFDQLHAVRDRPKARFPDAWRKSFESNSLHLHPVMKIAKALKLKAVAHIRLGQTPEAIDAWKDAMAMANALDATPCGIAAFTSILIESMFLDLLEEGIELHVWSDAQLQEFARILAFRDIPSRYRHAVAADRAFFNTHIETKIQQLSLRSLIRRSRPGEYELVNRFLEANEGWWWQNLLRLNQRLDEEINYFEMVDGRLAGAGRSIPISDVKDGEPESFYFLVHMGGPSITRKMAHTHARLRLAIVACALERIRAAEEKHPSRLEELVPRFLAELPRDPCSGAPFPYRLRENGSYVLYSIGLDGKDDQGDGGEGEVGGSRMPDWPWIWIPPSKMR